MKLSVILLPVILLLAPLILVVMASFTTVAVVTSVLALIVVWVRLGFLAAEFSGGVLMDIVGWGMRKWVKAEDQTNVKVAKTKVENKKINSKEYNSYHQHKQKKQQRKQQKELNRVAAAKVNMWETNKISVNFEDKVLLKELALNGGEFYAKRPHGRRAKSDNNYTL
ncbi:4369_t:CDS:1 [Ambispora leptoticha]|uniref:4369_t:CDS:1 n=1 Tax=Ambispora leptoticha TaxID=144679 RepID=A0A9N8WPH9_9GLOM|nr:4369_t:CDS:1 [Ambispora leptoticha]